MFPIGDENLPGRGAAWVTLGLIAVNIAVFLFLQGGSADNTFTYGWSSIAREITTGVDLTQAVPIVIDGTEYLIPQAPGPDPIFLTLLSSMFMHGSLLHLGGNMLYLWIFGDNIERVMGSVKFLIFYLVCGLAASAAHILFNLQSPVPAVGASGAISGVLGGYLLLFPKNRVRVLTRGGVTQVPALLVLGFWIVLQFINGIGSVAATEATAGVAYMAHIGGFVAGIVLVKLFVGRGRAGAFAR